MFDTHARLSAALIEGISLVGCSEEAGEDGHGKHLPKDLHVVCAHCAPLLSIDCRFSGSPTTPALCWKL
jgi:hypothetical protein